MTMFPNPLTGCPRIGMGCWAIGGPFWGDGTPFGYAGADDDESARTIDAAWEAGVRVFDTASVYGAGHSERVLGATLGNRPDSVVVSKFGPVFDEETRQVTGNAHDPASIRASTEASLARLRRDRVDVLLCHINTLEIGDVPEVFGTLETLRKEGLIGAYGWSTDFPERLDAAAGFPGFAAVEHAMNLFFDAPSISQVAARHGLPQLIRSPLAMGVLTGKFARGAAFDRDDVRSATLDWMDYFKDGKVNNEVIDKLAAVRELLTTGGRTLGQGALCWLLAKSDALIPVPGAKSVAQVRENAGALDLGPLPDAVMEEIEAVLDRPPEGPPRER